MPEHLPALPQGWIAQWDSQSGHYYYAEQATGRTQWERPLPSGYSAGPPAGYDSSTRGHDAHYGGGQYGGASGGYYPPQGYPPQGGHYDAGYSGDGHKKEKKSGKGGVLLGAAGGLAAGAIGGALIANALRKCLSLFLEKKKYTVYC